MPVYDYFTADYDYFNLDLDKAIKHAFTHNFKSFVCNCEEYVLFDGKFRKVMK